MATPQERIDELNDVIERNQGKLDEMLSNILEAEVDHTALDLVRKDMKEWVNEIKDDCVIYFAMHLIGHGKKWVFETQDKLRQAGNDIDPDTKIKLTTQVQEVEKKISFISELCLKMERNEEAGKTMREEICKWIEGLSPDYLLFFSLNCVGVGAVFAKYIELEAQKIQA